MLYIIRHGKTEWNAIHKLQGQTDIPLNEEGRQMAQLAAEEYKNISVDECYCSPLLRAKETAEILLAGRNIPIKYDDRLKEMNFGIYEGSFGYFTDKNNPINVLFRDPNSYIAAPEGESLEELFARTGDIMDKEILPKVEAGKDILIVGHGAMNSSIICKIRGLTKEHLWDESIENCRLFRLI